MTATMAGSWSAWVGETWRPTHAWAGAVTLASLYVLSLYLWPRRLRSPRDHPAVIRARVVSLVLTCVVSCALPGIALQVALPCEASLNAGVMIPTLISGATGIGSVQGALVSTVASLFLCVSLFLGPLVALVLDGGTDALSRLFRNALSLSTAVKWRNHIVAPVTEEWVFRGVCAPTLVFAGAATVAGAVFQTPLLFGLAHAHHFFEVKERALERLVSGNSARNRSSAGGKDSTPTSYQLRTLNISATKNAAAVVAAQFAYTYLFGTLAVFLLLRTGSICAPIAAHGFCNVLGVPDLRKCFTGRNAGLLAVAYVVGICVFTAALWPATDPSWHAESKWRDLVAISRATREMRKR